MAQYHQSNLLKLIFEMTQIKFWRKKENAQFACSNVRRGRLDRLQCIVCFLWAATSRSIKKQSQKKKKKSKKKSMQTISGLFKNMYKASCGYAGHWSVGIFPRNLIHVTLQALQLSSMCFRCNNVHYFCT